MTTAAVSYIPAPQSVELHLSPSPEFSRYSKKVKALGGRYTECRGNSSKRFVDLPWTDDGRELANKLVAEFGSGSRTTLVVRGVDTFRKKHVHAWVVVHKVDQKDADPCASLLAKYEAAFLQAFPNATEPEPEPEPAKPPVLSDFLTEWGFSLVREAHGISVYERENVEVYVNSDTNGVEIVVRNDDGWSEKRSLVLPGAQWPVHAAAEIVRAVLSERNS